MNAAMESVRSLIQHIEASPDELGVAFANYEAERKPDADAIADMALGNYLEMRSGVIDPDYLAKRALALELEERHPEHLSPRYNMVMFSTMPYSEARDRATAQAEIMSLALAAEATGETAVDLDALVTALAPLPDLDPLADPKALSTS